VRNPISASAPYLEDAGGMLRTPQGRRRPDRFVHPCHLEGWRALKLQGRALPISTMARMAALNTLIPRSDRSHPIHRILSCGDLPSAQPEAPLQAKRKPVKVSVTGKWR